MMKHYLKQKLLVLSVALISIFGSSGSASAQTQLPYLEDFDQGAAGWTSASTGGGNDWMLGTPVKSFFSGAYSAPNGWATSLNANYVDAHNGAIISPAFDFSALVSDPSLRFTHKFITESCCDGGVLEMSVNGGGWTTVDNSQGSGGNFNTTNSKGWYNGNVWPIGSNCWLNNSSFYSSADANGWIKSQTVLTGAAGQSNVRLRFRFGSDGSVREEGWLIDNIEIFNLAGSPYAQTGTYSILTNTNVTLAGAAHDLSNSLTLTSSGVLVSTSPNPTIGGVGVIDSPSYMNGAGRFRIFVDGLTPGTTYYYRAYAVSLSGTTYGVDSTFTTLLAPLPPFVQNAAPLNVEPYEAKVGGTIINNGGTAVTASGVVYSTTTNPMIGAPGVVDSTSNPVVTSGNYSVTAGGLTPGTWYYYSFYAVNAAGTSYGPVDSFETPPLVSSIPYLQNFDVAGNTGWYSEATGGVNNWELGTPAKPYITGPASSPNSWVTRVTGDYSDGHNAAVVSVQFDFSSLTLDPLLKFSHTFITESCCDGAVVEISINGGAWTTLDNTIGSAGNFNTPNSLGWYNGNVWPVGSNCWRGMSTDYDSNVGGWITSRTVLTGAAGQSNVRIRFRFASDGSSVRDGWAIDDIEIYPPSAPTVLTSITSYMNSANGWLNGMIDDNGGLQVTSSGVVYSTSPNPVIGGMGVADSTTNPVVKEGKFGLFVSGLTPSTIYYYRAYATNPVGTGYGADSIFVTDPSPSVPLMQNDFAQNIGYASVTLGGTALSDGGDPITATGLIYSTSNNPLLGGPGVIDSPNTNMNLPYKFDILGLTPSTWYYYRVYGVNSVGTGYGEIDSFLTDPTIITTGTSSLVTSAQAKLSGNIRNIFSAGDNGTITQSGILLSTSPNPVIGGMGVTDSLTNPLVNNGDFEIMFHGLSAGTMYYFRAYATSSMGTYYGVDSSFITNASALPPDILTGRIGNVAAYTATVGGEILTDGGDPIISSGVVYSTSPTPTIGGMGVVDSTTNPLVTNGIYTFSIAGLTSSTTYYVRAYAINAQGTSYGLEDVFKTDTVITTLPYAENYDVTVETGWEAESTGGNNDWELGSPSKANITGPLSAPNSWVTRIFGDYSDDHDAALISPQFDFSTITHDPIVRFSHQFLTEGCCDGGVLEISINGGAWVNVNNVPGSGANFNTPTNKSWYNGNLGRLGGNCWLNSSYDYSSNASGWIQSEAILTGAAGQSDVRIRFRFATDPSVTEEGWAIDNVTIVEPVTATILTGTSFNITQASATLFGDISSNGGSPVTASGVVIGTAANPSVGDPGVIDSATNPVVTEGPFSVAVSGLNLSTTYHYRAYAVNAIGTSYGPDSTFTTFASAVTPYLVQDPAFNVAQQVASVSATITSDGGDPVIASGVVLSLTPNPVVGGMGVTDSVTNPVVTLGSFSIDFGSLLPNTVYYVRAYAINGVGVGYGMEDTFITDPIITTLPYTQNFDVLSNNGWKGQSTGGANDWETGTPFKSYISAALSSPNVWITKLSGAYSDGHDGSLISPQFDLSAYTVDPVLRFSHKFWTESCCDGGMIEMSLDGGITWLQLDDNLGNGPNNNTASSIAWYNNNDPGFNGWGDMSDNFGSQVNGWIRSETRLIGAAGQSNVRFRFRFLSDGSVVEEGWAIDDIEVVNIPLPTMQASSVSTGSITNNEINVSWINGDGAARIVVARFDTSANVVPSDWNLYQANSVFGAGQNLGSFNYVVYNGTGTDVTVTGLPPFRTFTFVVYEYNGNEMLVRYLAPGATATATTLPVTYVSFTGKKSASDAVLNWATATEKNNKGFEVERSLDGKNFEYAGFVKGSGNSSVKQQYTFTDKGIFANATNKVVLYRLKQIDFDGKSEYSKTVAISVSQEAGKDVVVYPNPFSSAFTVQVETPVATLAKLELYDMQGRLVSTMERSLNAGTTAVDVTAWNASQSGVYILRVSYADTVKTIRLVKTAE